MQSLVPRSRSRIGFVLAFAIVTGAFAPSEAAAPVFCRPVVTPFEDAAVMRRTTTCDGCRTSGSRAGFKRCCEQVGRDYRCGWVRC